MKNFLMTTTFLAGIALGGAAFAQTAPVTDANGNPLYTWTDTSGNLVQGTYAEFTAAAPVAPVLADFTDIPAGPTAAEQLAAATASYNTASAAYASSLTQLAGDPAPYQPNSLLDNLLSNATNLQASLSNVAENLNNVNGSINVATSRSLTDMASVVDALSNGGKIPFGSYSQVGANVYGQDLPASLLAVLNPTVASLGDLSTTAIGAMQSGSITATIDASGLVDKASSAATGSTTSANLAAETYGNIGNTLAFQNIANNAGAIDGSVTLALADVNATVGKVATTAIGAMGSGSLTANISGNMEGVARSSSGIIESLVGTTTP
jgi:hypothetical protein